VTQVNFESL